MGMIITARNTAVKNSNADIKEKPNASRRNGIYMTVEVRTRDASIDTQSHLLWLFIVNIEPLLDLILNEWKISTSDIVRKAIVIPSGLSTEGISNTPDSKK